MAAATLAAVFAQFFHVRRTAFQIVNYFSFFTIESNIFAAAVLVIAALGLARNSRQDNGVAPYRGAATLYMITTGVVYILLLAGTEEDLQTTIPWTNLVMHYGMPAALTIDWLAQPGRLLRSYPATVARWLAFPLAYAAYTLLRGALTQWYPYPFINARTHGYGSVSFTIVLIAIAISAVALLIAWYAGARHRLPSYGCSR